MTPTNSDPTTTPQPTSSDINLNTDGDVNVGGSVVGRDMITVNNTVTLTLSGDLMAQLEQIKALSTELTKAAGKAAPPALASVKSTEAIKSVDTALELLQRADPAGAPAQELQSGALQISRVELLLKKAILLEMEAEELLFDGFLQAGNRTTDDGARVLPDDFDHGPRLAKLKEAEALLREANQMDPANTEVLARLALNVVDGSPDRVLESLKYLNRVVQLISTPRDEAEKFRLAQARYFLAINQDPPDEVGMLAARSTFEDLGRLEWVAYVDEDLAPDRSGGDFDPVGPWVISVNDEAQTVIEVEMFEDGHCQGQVQGRASARSKKSTLSPFAGEWTYDPEQQVLGLGGEHQSGSPFQLAVQIQGHDENGYHAIDQQGQEHLLHRP